MGRIYKRAIDSKQYDLGTIKWHSETADSPFRKFFISYLKKYTYLWKNADVLEIGSGLGWLLNLIKQEGANIVEGIEPSKKNIAWIKDNFSQLRVFNTDFQNFKTERKYDLIIAVMVFNHIGNITEMLAKAYSLLKDKGELQIIVPEFTHYRLPTYHHKVEFEKINDEEYAISVTRDDGTLADVIRKIGVYKREAHKTKFEFVEAIPLLPTKELIKSNSKYKKYEKGPPHSYLIRFQK